MVFFGGKSWHQALVGSAVLALRYKRLALVFFAVLLALCVRYWFKALLPYGWWLTLPGCALIEWATLSIQGTALVAVYREMINREAAAQPPESA
jgi:hypothetical protein